MIKRLWVWPLYMADWLFRCVLYLHCHLWGTWAQFASIAERDLRPGHTTTISYSATIRFFDFWLTNAGLSSLWRIYPATMIKDLIRYVCNQFDVESPIPNSRYSPSFYLSESYRFIDFYRFSIWRHIKMELAEGLQAKKGILVQHHPALPHYRIPW